MVLVASDVGELCGIHIQLLGMLVGTSHVFQLVDRPAVAFAGWALVGMECRLVCDNAWGCDVLHAGVCLLQLQVCGTLNID